jgi:hypothetical protein
MSYLKWFNDQAKKHKVIIDKLCARNLSKDEIIDYFNFENMKVEEPNFCPLYKENKKCHTMDSLNCYLCACPNFRFQDEGIQKVDAKMQYSLCDIKSKDGRLGVYGDVIHQDCSACGIPHHRSYVEKHFDYNWSVIMQKCLL